MLSSSLFSACQSYLRFNLIKYMLWKGAMARTAVLLFAC